MSVTVREEQQFLLTLRNSEEMAIDLTGSVRGTSVIAKLKQWVIGVFKSVFSAKCGNPQ